METAPIRIVILDNHAMIRAGLRLLVENEPGIKVVGEAGNNGDGLKTVSSLKPNIILLRLNLEGPLNFDIIPGLIKVSKHARLILVTGTQESKVLHKAVDCGVVGVVNTTQAPDTLIKAIQKVNAGEVWLERSMIADIISRRSRNQPPISLSAEMGSINKLSDREKQIIRLIGKGAKNKDISVELCISETTVRHHLTSIYNKLGVSDRLELLVFAHRNGMIDSAIL